MVSQPIPHPLQTKTYSCCLLPETGHNAHTHVRNEKTAVHYTFYFDNKQCLMFVCFYRGAVFKSSFVSWEEHKTHTANIFFPPQIMAL